MQAWWRGGQQKPNPKTGSNVINSNSDTDVVEEDAVHAGLSSAALIPAFNPITPYFAHDENGRLVALLLEVRFADSFHWRFLCLSVGDFL